MYYKTKTEAEAKATKNEVVIKSGGHFVTFDRRIARRVRNEQKIARRVIKDLLAFGLLIDVYDGEEITLKRSKDPVAILDAMMTSDDDRLFARKKGWGESFVWFIYGNGNEGFDVISDYGMMLEPIMKPIFDYIGKLEAGEPVT